MTQQSGTGTIERPLEARSVLYLVHEGEGPHSDGLELRDLMRILWAGWRLIALSTALAAVLGVSYALTARPWYTAEVLLAPAEGDMGQGLASRLGQLGSLVGIAGLAATPGNRVESIALLRSQGFLRSFIQDKDLVGLLVEDGRTPMSRLFVGGESESADVRDAILYFDKHVRSVSEDRKTGLVTLGIAWRDASMAAEWANTMVARLNAQMRARAIADANQNIAFLRQELASTSIVPMQQSIGRLLEAELQKLMLARGNAEFAFRVVDAAQAPKRRSRPQRLLIIAGSLLLGGAAGCGWVIARHYLRSARAT